MLNIEKLQAGCPNLKILRMANTKVMARSVSQREQVIVANELCLKHFMVEAFTIHRYNINIVCLLVRISFYLFLFRDNREASLISRNLALLLILKV